MSACVGLDANDRNLLQGVPSCVIQGVKRALKVDAARRETFRSVVAVLNFASSANNPQHNATCPTKPAVLESCRNADDAGAVHCTDHDPWLGDCHAPHNNRIA